MNEELKEQIKEYIKENLSVEIRQKREFYSETDYYEIKLILDGEVISESYT